ncbi:MAG: hypothetical protein KDA89_25270 [Planctomycetaceae bacterium]|nr:hypothetical protein [Planctomycetaceae bacterium]
MTRQDADTLEGGIIAKKLEAIRGRLAELGVNDEWLNEAIKIAIVGAHRDGHFEGVRAERARMVRLLRWMEEKSDYSSVSSQDIDDVDME